MKKKKLLGMALTGTMVLAMAVPAFAEEAQDIINAKSGTGTLLYDRKGNWKHKELIDCDKEIGIDVDVNTQKETPTDKATVHYSKTGTHLVPRKGENHD